MKIVGNGESKSDPIGAIGELEQPHGANGS